MSDLCFLLTGLAKYVLVPIHHLLITMSVYLEGAVNQPLNISCSEKRKIPMKGQGILQSWRKRLLFHLFRTTNSMFDKGVKAYEREGRTLRLKVVGLPETTATILESFEEKLFEGCQSILYVVDITDDYVDSLTKLCALALQSRNCAPELPIEVFLHKADSFAEQEKQGPGRI